MISLKKVITALVWLNIISIGLNVYIFFPSNAETAQKTQSHFNTLRKPNLLNQAQAQAQAEAQAQALAKTKTKTKAPAPAPAKTPVKAPAKAPAKTKAKTQTQTLPSSPSPYNFTDPKKAYDILTQLDIFSTIPKDALPKSNYNKKAWWMLKKGQDYCAEHRRTFVNDPSFLFGRPYIVSTYGGNIKNYVVPKVGKDITIWRNKDGKTLIDEIHLLTNIFFTKTLFFYRRQVGSQFSCLTQESSHVPGHSRLYRKDTLSQSLKPYLQNYKTRPQCAGYNKYFIKNYLLTQKDECQAFFKQLNSKEYAKQREERNIVYFRKIAAGAHQGRGVFIVNNKDEAYMRKLYKNGSDCGNVTQNNLIQLNIHNLLLVENRKFGFRSFMLVASTNPVIAYYHDGYARLSLNEYNSRSNETSTFVTNIHVNAHNPLVANWTKRQIDDFTYWPMERFAEHLYKKGIVNDSNWLENHLRKEFMKVKVHLLRMAQGGFFNISSLFELYGLDYVMDENLNLWFIECNTMPLITGFNSGSYKLFNQMLVDMFDIMSGILKSRAKRIILYVNKVIASGGLKTKNIEERRREFALISQNAFEPEYRPSPNNSFYPIVDENRNGTERYFNLIDKDCL